MDKITKISLVIITWACLSILMSVVYYWLKDIGFIFDNPDWLTRPDGSVYWNEMSWNTRKLIFGITGLAFFILAGVRIIIIANEE